MPRDPERMAQAGLIDRSGDLFHQLAQLRNQLLLRRSIEMAIGALRMGYYRNILHKKRRLSLR